MKRILLTALAIGSIGSSLSAQQPTTASPQTELVAQYCATCHSERGKAGQLSLAGWTPQRATGMRDTTEKMIKKLRAGMMPP
ncbi:MAG: cytochrome c, partial [Alphaproteobacteria bacterium]|nr:cytochrome c [Alphaproteobacteria bacterium]